MPFVFVADEGFGLSQRILVPYAGNFLNEKENVTGFHKPADTLNTHLESLQTNGVSYIDHECEPSTGRGHASKRCVLDNFVRERDGVKIENILTVEGMTEMDPDTGPRLRLASNLRQVYRLLRQ